MPRESEMFGNNSTFTTNEDFLFNRVSSNVCVITVGKVIKTDELISFKDKSISLQDYLTVL